MATHRYTINVPFHPHIPTAHWCPHPNAPPICTGTVREIRREMRRRYPHAVEVWSAGGPRDVPEPYEYVDRDWHRRCGPKSSLPFADEVEAGWVQAELFA